MDYQTDERMFNPLYLFIIMISFKIFYILNCISKLQKCISFNFTADLAADILRQLVLIGFGRSFVLKGKMALKVA